MAKAYKLEYGLKIDNAKIIETSLPAELLTNKTNYDYIISVSTTALITIKAFNQKKCCCVSIGAEQIDDQKYTVKSELLDIYKKLGVKIIAVS